MTRLYTAALIATTVLAALTATDVEAQLEDKIVFTSGRTGNNDIWMMNPDGTNQVQITFDMAHDGNPTLSPEGTKLAFDSQRTGSPDIWVLDLLTGDLINLTPDNPLTDDAPAWSPDGAEIAFRSERGTTSIWVVAATGGAASQLTFAPSSTLSDASPHWHPFGGEIVFMSTRGH